MKYLIPLMFLLTGCGTGNADTIVRLLSAEPDPSGSQAESVCVRGELKGTFTQTDLIYMKKSWPKDAQEPNC